MSTLLQTIGTQAQDAANTLATFTPTQKNKILKSMAHALRKYQTAILDANHKDLIAGTEKQLSMALLDRLKLNADRIEAMARGLDQVAALPDPVGNTLETLHPREGLSIQKVSVPIGVIAVIYESRPNVTADIAGLCFKSGNSVILRGGSEAMHSNQAIHAALLAGIRAEKGPEHAVQLVASTDRALIDELVQMVGVVDLVIPRGGHSLIQRVTQMARVPVIKHDKGLCHIYVDAHADLNMAARIIENAKCQRPGVCNAVETVLIHEKIAARFLPNLAKILREHHVELRGDAAARRIVPELKTATEVDWDTEYLDLILSIKIVKSLEEAIDHINRHGSKHSDAIVSDDARAQTEFTARVHSAVVYINASTRFTDGFEFGMGAEIGISTDKIHARGPMGLKELTTYKYVARGAGHIR